MKLLIDIPEHIYEHAKETTEDSRDEFDAMRAIANGTPARCMDEAEKERLIKKNMLSIENRVRNVFNQGYEMGVKKNKSEIPNTCGDAISRQAAIRAIEALQRPIMREESNYYQFKFSGMSEALGAVENLPSVIPQQRTGQWIAQDIHNCHTRFECSECGYIHNFMHLYGEPTADYTYCPYCGAKMEVEE